MFGNFRHCGTVFYRVRYGAVRCIHLVIPHFSSSVPSPTKIITHNAFYTRLYCNLSTCSRYINVSLLTIFSLASSFFDVHPPTVKRDLKWKYTCIKSAFYTLCRTAKIHWRNLIGLNCPVENTVPLNDKMQYFPFRLRGAPIQYKQGHLSQYNFMSCLLDLLQHFRRLSDL